MKRMVQWLLSKLFPYRAPRPYPTNILTITKDTFDTRKQKEQFQNGEWR